MRALFVLSPLFGMMIAGASTIGTKTLGDGDLPEFLQRFDTNGDDQIDEEERQAIRDLRSKLRQENRQSIDSDNDGVISGEEIEDARRTIRRKIEERRRRKFMAIAGEDAFISPSEYAAIPGIEQLPDPVFQTIWSHLDVDDDGFISLKEFSGTLRLHD